MPHAKDLPSILDEMTADLVLNREDGKITILHDTPFDDVLMSFEYLEKRGTLLFRFQNKTQTFGKALYDEFAEFMRKNDIISVLHIDMETKEVIEGLEVPLKVV